MSIVFVTMYNKIYLMKLYNKNNKIQMTARETKKSEEPSAKQN